MSFSRIISIVLSFLGITLIIAAISTFIFGSVQRSRGDDIRSELLSELKELTPNVVDSVPDDRGITDMPSIQVNGYDLVGMIEVPAYGRELPVGCVWSPESLHVMPYRFFGSIYEGKLIIGGSAHNGQFDFLKKISIGDSVFYTDVDGCRYSLKVTDILISNEVTAEYFAGLDSNLVLFARNLYSFDYTVVVCSYG